MEYVPVVMQFSNTKMCGSMKEQIKKEGGGSLENWSLFQATLSFSDGQKSSQPDDSTNNGAAKLTGKKDRAREEKKELGAGETAEPDLDDVP